MKSILLAGLKSDVKVKALRKLASQAGFRVETSPLESLKKVTTVPDITLIDVNNPDALAELVRDVIQIQSQAPTRSRVLFSVDSEARNKKAHGQRPLDVMGALNQQLKAFPNPDLVDVTFAQPPEHMAALLALLGHKIDLAQAAAAPSQAAPRPSPLDKIKEVIQATEDLRAENGKLSAEAVAKAIGVTLSRLADWLGRSRQAVSKTPDADSLQNDLAFFERVARLRTVVNKEGFLKWLRMPNTHLDNKKPLEMLAGGERQVVADLVDDMLTGMPA